MHYIGVDPGVGGGIAVLAADGHPLAAFKMPATSSGLLDALRPFGRDRCDQEGGNPGAAVLERVSASPQMGVVSAFSFGKGYGRLEVALTATLIDWTYVTPNVWQTALRCRTGGDKNISKARASKLFPQLTITHAIADALLMAEFCRRLELGLFRRPLTGV